MTLSGCVWGNFLRPAQRRQGPSLVVISGPGLPPKETISLEMQKSKKKIQLGLWTEAKSIKEKMSVAPRTSRAGTSQLEKGRASRMFHTFVLALSPSLLEGL